MPHASMRDGAEAPISCYTNEHALRQYEFNTTVSCRRSCCADFGLAVFFDPADLPRTDLGLEGTPWYIFRQHALLMLLLSSFDH